MRRTNGSRRGYWLFTAAALLTVAGCRDAPTTVQSPDAFDGAAASARSENAATREVSSVRWNREALRLFRARPTNPGRSNAYLALAQYRAVLAASNARHGQVRPSLAGAAAGASVVVLKQFYPLDGASIDAALAVQRALPPQAEERNMDFAAGEAIGRTIGAAVLAYAAGDNFGLTSPGNPPGTPNTWTSNGTAIVRGGLGARPFFLLSGNEINSPPPPAYGSPEFLSALAEVRAMALGRTPEQTAITFKWLPFSGPLLNELADELIIQYNRNELEAARILAYANTAAFDAIIACFSTKFQYWYIRPHQADPSIPLIPGVGVPNHPSYPSGHSCEAGAFHGVLIDAFPSERARLELMAEEGKLSRMYGVYHYRFDVDAAGVIGRSAARLALSRRGLE
ncbi:MAG: vanadium-dependent haloperoxidase [Gemmatimonadota bacterium]